MGSCGQGKHYGDRHDKAAALAGAEDLKETGEPDIVTKKISKPRSKTTVTPVLGDSVRGCARAIT